MGDQSHPAEWTRTGPQMLTVCVHFGGNTEEVSVLKVWGLQHPGLHCGTSVSGLVGFCFYLRTLFATGPSPLPSGILCTAVFYHMTLCCTSASSVSCLCRCQQACPHVSGAELTTSGELGFNGHCRMKGRVVSGGSGDVVCVYLGFAWKM